MGALYLIWMSLLSFTIRCWFKEQKPNIKLLNQIATSSFAQFLFVTDIFEVSFQMQSPFLHDHMNLEHFSFQPYGYADIEVENINDFSKVIDRLLFIIFSMIFLICIAIGYY